MQSLPHPGNLRKSAVAAVVAVDIVVVAVGTVVAVVAYAWEFLRRSSAVVECRGQEVH